MFNVINPISSCCPRMKKNWRRSVWCIHLTQQSNKNWASMIDRLRKELWYDIYKTHLKKWIASACAVAITLMNNFWAKITICKCLVSLIWHSNWKCIAVDSLSVWWHICISVISSFSWFNQKAPTSNKSTSSLSKWALDVEKDPVFHQTTFRLHITLSSLYVVLVAKE